MNLSLGIVLLWLAMALFWVAFHNLGEDVTTPWAAVQKVVEGIKGGGAAEGTEGAFVPVGGD